MTDEQRQKLRGLGYVEMMQRVWSDQAFCDLLKSNPEAAVSALLGFAVKFADLDKESRKHVEHVLAGARARLSHR
jgi:hypothetical protein